MPEAADHLAALAAYLKTTGVNDLVDGRIFRPELDSDLVEGKPLASVVIGPAGGYQNFGGALIPIGDPRVDIWCYAATRQAYNTIANEVVLALKRLRTCTFENTRLMGARIEGGPTPGVDPQTNWPCAVVTAQLVHCQLALT